MQEKYSRPAPARPVVENLENRTLLSGVGSLDAGVVVEHSAIIVPAKAAKVKLTGTKTSLAITSGTLGQPITFTVTVRTAAAAGAPTGTIELLEKKSSIQSGVTLTPTTSTNPKYAISVATYTITPQPGGSAPFFGKYPITAVFVPTGTFATSHAGKNFSVAKPKYTSLAHGVKIETIVAGSGAGIADGQMASALYTGYLAKKGSIFDDSSDHATNGVLSPFSFTVGAGQVIAGFDEGAVGMEVGETRLIYIPWQEGYGKAGQPPSIPGKADLIFVLTLESIS